MTEIRIIAREAKMKPDYRKTAAELLKRCRDFFQDPENEQAFLEWKAGKEEKDDGRDHRAAG